MTSLHCIRSYRELLRGGDSGLLYSYCSGGRRQRCCGIMRLLATRNISRRVRCGSSFDMYHTLNRAHRGVWAARHLLLGVPPTINELPLAETLCIAVVFQRTSGIGPTKISRIERVRSKAMSHNRASWKHTKACFAEELLGRHEMIKLSLSPNKQIQVHHARCVALPTSHRVRGCAASLPHHCVGDVSSKRTWVLPALRMKRSDSALGSAGGLFCGGRGHSDWTMRRKAVFQAQRNNCRLPETCGDFRVITRYCLLVLIFGWCQFMHRIFQICWWCGRALQLSVRKTFSTDSNRKCAKGQQLCPRWGAETSRIVVRLSLRGVKSDLLHAASGFLHLAPWVSLRLNSRLLHDIPLACCARPVYVYGWSHESFSSDLSEIAIRRIHEPRSTGSRVKYTRLCL